MGAMTSRQAMLFALIASAGSAGAVSLGPDGSGQVLLFPYYTVNGSQDTLLTIGNRVDEAQIVKVRFLEGYNGRPVLDFDVYLDANDVWTAVVTAGEGGGAMLRTADPGCTVPAIPASGAPFTTAMFDIVGEEVTTLADFYRKVWTSGPAGAEIPMRVLRDGRDAWLRVKTADRQSFLKKPQLQ